MLDYSHEVDKIENVFSTRTLVMKTAVKNKLEWILV